MVHSKPKHKIHCLDTEHLENPKREFQAMKEVHIICCLDSPWASLSIWCLKQMGPGAHAVITPGSTMQQLQIGSHCQTSPSFQLGWLAVLLSLNWIW